MQGRSPKSNDTDRQFRELTDRLDWLVDELERRRLKKQRYAVGFPFSVLYRMINGTLTGLERMVRRFVDAILKDRRER